MESSNQTEWFWSDTIGEALQTNDVPPFVCDPNHSVFELLSFCDSVRPKQPILARNIHFLKEHPTKTPKSDAAHRDSPTLSDQHNKVHADIKYSSRGVRPKQLIMIQNIHMHK